MIKKCKAPYGVSPIQGVVDGEDQSNKHNTRQSIVKKGESVTVVTTKQAEVKTGSGIISGKVSVVTIAEKPGWYLASAFA